MFEKRITIFAGHFGSGKTEVAVNFALHMKTIHPQVAILDFDIVNPFFRTADAKQTLEAQGISVFLPENANKNVEASNFPLEVNTVFANKELFAIFDVGGDDLGAKAISRFRDKFLKESFDLFFVVNARRPMTDSVEKIVAMCREIEDSAGIKPTGLINNTNLLQYTTKEVIEEGHLLLLSALQQVGCPIAFATGMEPALSEANLGGIEKFVLNKNIHLPWNK